MIVQMAISRTREYEADRIGAEICGRPLWLANALENIQASAARIDNVQAENNPATAHMFIINPLHSRSVGGLFRTHPSTEERVRRLRAMAGPAAASPLGAGGFMSGAQGTVGPVTIPPPAPGFRTGRLPATSHGSGADGRSAGPGCRRRRHGRPA